MRVHVISIVLMLTIASCENKSARLGAPLKMESDQILEFKKLDASVTNIRFKNSIPESAGMNSLAYEYYYNGGGVAVADLDEDGLPELFFTGNRIHNKLYKNLGNLVFKDITEAAGITDGPSWTTGVTVADINNDGILDIYVCRSGKLKAERRANLFFISSGIENGIPKYRENARALGLADTGYSTQALFFDYDRDGDLDMFLLNHNVEVRVFHDLSAIKSRRDPLVGDKLYRNDGERFTDVSAEAGIIGNEIGYGLGVSAGDLNNDGWPDLYVANDYSEHDYLYFNNRDGSFTESIKTATGHISNSSMGTDISDFNNDGLLDIVTMDMLSEDNYGVKTSMSGMAGPRFEHAIRNGLHYQYMVNTLQLNLGNGRFSEMARLGGVSSTNWSWAPLFADFDNDGYKDLFITNGIKRDFINYDFRNFKIKRLRLAEENKADNVAEIINELIRITPQRKVSNYIFRNEGDLTFSDRSAAWGIDEKSFSNGAAYGDLDNDGDLDIVINNIDDYPTVYRNNMQADKNNYLRVSLRGSPLNMNGIGARVIVSCGEQIQVQEQYFTRGYQSAVNKKIHFGLGKCTLIDQVTVKWPDGKAQFIENISPNQDLILDYADAEFRHPGSSSSGKKLFEKYKRAPTVTHRENDYDDFKKEGFLPYKMSRLGPGIAVGDVNNDGLDDVYIGGAKGQSGGIYVQDVDGAFSPVFSSESHYEDTEASFFDADNDGDFDLYVASGGNEFEAGDPGLRDRLYINTGNGNFHNMSQALPDIRSSSSCVEPCDYDKDGDPDLFIGTRLRPGQYPAPASSHLLENHNGKFTVVNDDETNGLTDLGLVTDAIWEDYDRDGWEDLIVVGEWLPITIFKNSRGDLFSQHEKIQLENSTGWWYCINSADFDKDGDMDFVAGNIGLNSKFTTSVEGPFHAFFADFDNSGSNDIVLGYFEGEHLYPYHSRDKCLNQIPFLNRKYPGYHEFGMATLKDIYGASNLKESLQLKALTFASSYAENLGGGRFKLTKLPNMAQLSCTRSIIVRDINLDGNEDLILAGNLLNTEQETPRIDGSYGLAMIGDGKGNFDPVHPSHSNLYISGEIPDMENITIGNRTAIITAVNNNAVEIWLYSNSREKKTPSP
ncbi:MAG: VCBS repeat-containing protein [Cytophagales bacterium]|nr:VCBS repeat-containing protein [Cytophagales bacterium]